MSKRFSKFLHALILLALLAACAPALPTPAPLPTPQALIISLDPALTWLEPALSACAATQPDLAILREDGGPSADLAMRFGPPASDPAFSAVIGNDELVIAVHPENPIESLSAAEVAEIFTREDLDWENFSPKSGSGAFAFSEPVQALVYPTDSAIHEAFLSAFSEIDRLADDMHVLPSPTAMREEIATRPGAIGLLPSRWLDDSVKSVSLSGLDHPKALRLPLVVTAAGEPQGAARAWLLCVQDILLPTNQT